MPISINGFAGTKHPDDVAVAVAEVREFYGLGT